MPTNRDVRLNVFCSTAVRNGLKAIAGLEGISLSELFEEISMTKIEQYPEIYQKIQGQQVDAKISPSKSNIVRR